MAKVLFFWVHRMRVRNALEGMMSDISELQAAVADLEASADSAEAMVLTAVEQGKAEVADLQAQIDALEAGGTITQEQIDSLTASVLRADESIDAIAAAVTPIIAGEPEMPEETPAETPSETPGVTEGTPA